MFSLVCQMFGFVDFGDLPFIVAYEVLFIIHLVIKPWFVVCIVGYGEEL